MPELKHRYEGLKRETVASYTVNYKDVFSLSYLYMLMHEWLCEQGWATRADEDFPEVQYLQKERPAGREIWARWRLDKNPFPGSNQKFWWYMLDIDIHVLTLKEVELVVKDKKLKADKGEVEVNVVANLIIDKEKEWDKNPWLKPFKEFFLKKFMLKKKEQLKKQLYNEAYDLQEAIKHYLKLETFTEAVKGKEFWAKRTIVE